MGAVLKTSVFAPGKKTCTFAGDAGCLQSSDRPAPSELRHFNLKYKYLTASGPAIRVRA